MRKQLATFKAIVINRQESGFDRACDAAYRMAIEMFGIDEDGYSSVIDGWERSCCEIEMQFMLYKRNSLTHIYTFSATPFKYEG